MCFPASVADDSVAAQRRYIGGVPAMPADLSDFPISADTRGGTLVNYRAARRWEVATGILITICLASAAAYLGYYVFAAVAGVAYLVR